MSKEVYKIISIYDPDYGCEGVPEGEEPQCRVILQREDGSTFYHMEPDARLYEMGIEEGMYVTISTDDKLALYISPEAPHA